MRHLLPQGNSAVCGTLHGVLGVRGGSRRLKSHQFHICKAQKQMHLPDDLGHMAESSFTGKSKTKRLGINYICFQNRFFKYNRTLGCLKGSQGFD